VTAPVSTQLRRVGTDPSLTVSYLGARALDPEWTMQPRTIENKQSLSQLTGAEGHFEAILDYVTASTSKALAADERQVRELLQTFRGDFEATYDAIVRRHVGDANMPALREALDSAAMRRFIQAWREMKASLEEQLRELSKRMGETPI